MKQLLKSILIFCSLMAGYLAINLLINFHRLTDPISLEGNVLIVGDSHLNTSLNPDQFASASNICMGGEAYILTFYKLKKAIEDNGQIDHVLCGFSYNNFSAYRDARLTGEKSKSQFSKYYPVLPLDLPEKIVVNETKFYHTFLRELTLYPNFSPPPYLGGFVKYPYELDKANLKETIRKHYYTNGPFIGISPYTEQFLDSIVSFTTEKNIELTLVSAPLHREYRSRIPEEIKTAFNKTKLRMTRKGILVLDFLDISYNDTLFKDYDHLNYEGAQIFTELIKKEISNRKMNGAHKKQDIENPADIRQQDLPNN